MTKEDKLRIENDLTKVVLRAKKAGIDGVEVQDEHCYLVNEFLLQLFNKRNDEYGGRWNLEQDLYRE